MEDQDILHAARSIQQALTGILNIECQIVGTSDLTIVTLDSEKAILVFRHPKYTDGLVRLFLEANMKSSLAASIVKIIANFLDAKSWILDQQFYYRESEGKTYYGAEAEEAKRIDSIRAQGFDICNYCDRVIPAHEINNDGPCSYCKDDVAKMLWM